MLEYDHHKPLMSQDCSGTPEADQEYLQVDANHVCGLIVNDFCFHLFSFSISEK